MVENNGDKEAKTKVCPFLNEYCITDRCALHTEITRNIGGLMQKSTLCGFNAIGLLLSEINAKTQPPQPRISMPHILRG